VLVPSRSPAVDIPFTQVFFGREFRSLLDDAAHYPASYVSIEATYWDIYFERIGVRLHDYDQQVWSATAIGRSDGILLGAATWSDELSLSQENVYSDDDRMAGSKNNGGGKGIAGYTLERDMPLALTTIEMLGAAGSNGEFLGEAEVQWSWARTADFLFKWETFANTLEIEEEIAGSRFPFHFPFETDRWFARTQVNAPSAFRFRAWGFYETNSGEGEVVEGFENRVWFERGGAGVTIDYRLEAAHRLLLTPRLSDAAARGPGVRLHAAHTGAEGELGMYFDGVRYLHLDGLHIENSVARLDVVPLRWLSVFGGWERLRAEHHGASFLDVWPFTIWDVFQARRYRLDDFESTLDTWFAGASGRVESRRFRGELAGRFEWWDSATELEWLERVEVLFPFFFRYERHREASELGTDYALQVDAALWWRFGAASLRVSGRATIPIEEEEAAGAGGGPPGGGGGGGTPASAPEEHPTHGGLMGTVELVIGQ
jgi:hypothetical protein